MGKKNIPNNGEKYNKYIINYCNNLFYSKCVPNSEGWFKICNLWLANSFPKL